MREGGRGGRAYRGEAAEETRIVDGRGKNASRRSPAALAHSQTTRGEPTAIQCSIRLASHRPVTTPRALPPWRGRPPRASGPRSSRGACRTATRGPRARAAAERHRKDLAHAAGSRGEEHDPVAQQQGLLQGVGDVDHRLAEGGPDAQQFLLHDRPGLRVEGGQRLVHEEHLGIVGQRAGDPHPLLHAARELVRIVPGEPGESDERQHSRARASRSGRSTPRFSRPNVTLSRTVRQGRSACS